MAIKFSIARRGLFPHEEAASGVSPETDVRNLRPQMESSETVDAVEFQGSSQRLSSVMSKSDLQSALGTLQRVMLHELEQGKAVTLPGIGTFRLALRGDIEVKDGNLHGRDVRVETVMFRPDRELLDKARGFEVDQVPFGLEYRTGELSTEARLAELFTRQDIITHKDVDAAFGHSLTRGRITSLLQRLVSEGRLAREGKGGQTRYRVL